MSVFHWIPPKYIGQIILLAALGILIIDAISSYAVLWKLTKPMPNIERINDELTQISDQLTSWLGKRVEERVWREPIRRSVSRLANGKSPRYSPRVARSINGDAVLYRSTSG